ncbi:hypothetical protein LOC67_09240 [Stieleria sp. JC731]|uniref:hypothetical protein n=1 Tax=Pirellulaceae TaxID=2691357 RepID=UPI001E3081DB|nr:hypothetical protein [Stieleria sp. JC731]MCC9600747.1 hypothetical protein [Stieleria sp. JC731]
MSEYAVVQTRFETIPAETLASILTGQGAMTHPDAMLAMRRHQGIVWEHFDRSRAESVQQALSDQGYAVDIVESDDLPMLGEPRQIRWFELDSAELRIPIGIHGDTNSVPWENVLVISLNQIAEVTKRPVSENPRMTSTSTSGLAISRDTNPKYQKRSKLIDVLDLICTDKEGGAHYLRLPCHQLAYSKIMGDGTNLSRFERFLVVVEYCVTHAPQAIVSPATRKALVTRQESSREVDGDGMQAIQDEAVQNRNRWLLYQSINQD